MKKRKHGEAEYIGRKIEHIGLKEIQRYALIYVKIS